MDFRATSEEIQSRKFALKFKTLSNFKRHFKQEEKKMTDYTAIPEKGSEDIHFQAESDSDARHWVINHLDLSKNYHIYKIGA